VDPRPEKIRILLVEDNPADVYLMRQALNEAPVAYDLVVAKNGEDALKLLSSDADRPALVLLDLNLPRVDGSAILDMIRTDERLRDLPVIVLSSSQAPHDKARSAALRRCTYIVKPPDLDNYLALGRRIYNFWRDSLP